MLVHALNHPDIRVLDRGRVLVVRVVGSFYFANIQRVRRELLALVDAEQPASCCWTCPPCPASTRRP